MREEDSVYPHGSPFQLGSEQPAPAEMPEAKLQASGFWRRALAFIVDLVLITAFYSILVWIGYMAMGLGLETLYLDSPSDRLLELFGTFYFVLWLVWFNGYFIYFAINGGQTPAKRLLGIKICKKNLKPLDWKTAILRMVGLTLSFFPLMGIGLLMAALPKKRAFHDLFAGTTVLKVS